VSRDALGRRVPDGDPAAVAPVPDAALAPEAALDLAQQLLDQGRAFGAHEVLEAVWKAAPAHERDLWQGLAQLCVGVTHLQRGNAVGGARLLRRGAGHLAALPGDLPYGLSRDLGQWSEDSAADVDRGVLDVPHLRLRG
jgi:hypothetical protein